MSVVGCFQSIDIQPCLALPNTVVKSSCSSVASRLHIRSKTSSCTSSGLQLGLSTLLMTTIGFLPIWRALWRTNLVWGMQPSKASTRRRTPSAMFSTLSTSPPKSLWPGVSMMLIFVFLYVTETFLARMVIPLSLSRSLLSRMRLPRSSGLRTRLA